MMNLTRQVDRLCARCDALAREVRRLREENRQLRDKSALAKQKIGDIIKQIPEIGVIDGERIN